MVLLLGHPWAPPSPRSHPPSLGAPHPVFSTPSQRWRCCSWNQRPSTARLWRSRSCRDRTLGLPEGTAAGGTSDASLSRGLPLGTRASEQDRDQQTCNPSPAPRSWTSLGRPGCGQGGHSSPPPAPRLRAGPGLHGQLVLVPHPALPGWTVPSQLCPLRGPLRPPVLTLEPGPAAVSWPRGGGRGDCPGRRGQAALGRGRVPWLVLALLVPRPDA